MASTPLSTFILLLQVTLGYILFSIFFYVLTLDYIPGGCSLYYRIRYDFVVQERDIVENERRYVRT